MTAASLPAREPIRLGIIGTGLAAKKLHWPAIARMPERFALIAFANRTRSTAEEFAALAHLSMADYHPDYHDLLRRDDVEAVVVGVPIPQLYSITRDCLAAGKHVICEKPPGADLAEALRFVALPDEYPGQKILMAENFFYRDDLRLARSLVDDGAIGRPQLLTERWVHRLVPTPGEFSITPWRYKPAYLGGPLLDGGVHPIAGIRLIAGDVVSLYARTERTNPTMDAPSALTMSFDLASGAIGNCVWGFLGNPVVEEANDTRLYGSEGALIVTRGRVRLVRADGSVEEYQLEASDFGYYNEFLNFYDAVVHDELIVGTIAQSLKNMLVVLRAMDSSEQRRPMELSDAPGGLSAQGVPLWRPRGASGLFDGLPTRIRRATV